MSVPAPIIPYSPAIRMSGVGRKSPLSSHGWISSPERRETANCGHSGWPEMGDLNPNVTTSSMDGRTERQLFNAKGCAGNSLSAGSGESVTISRVHSVMA